MREIGKGDEQCRGDHRRPEYVDDRPLGFGFADQAQSLRRRQGEARKRAVDPLERARFPVAVKQGNAFRYDQPYDGDEHGCGHGAESEHVTPCPRFQQLLHCQAAQNPANGIADDHQSQRQIAPAHVGKLCRRGIYGGQHAADAKPGQQPPTEQCSQPVSLRCTVHSRRHRDQASQYRGSAPRLVGNPAQRDRS